MSKGPQYLATTAGAGGQHPVVDGLTALWVRVVDYSAHPPFTGPFARATLPKDPTTGAFLVVGGLKKALLQSAPWMAVAFGVLILAVVAAKGLDPSRRRLLRGQAALVGAVLGTFAAAGLQRHDGWTFNQRYLLELVPLLAVALALAVDRWRLDPGQLVIGGAAGVALVVVPLSLDPEHWFRQRALMIVPLVLAAGLVLSWVIVARRDRLHGIRAGLLAACVGWSLAVHWGDDAQAARARREFRLFQLEAIAAALPREPTALFAVSPVREATCPLLLDRDIVVVNPGADRGADAPVLLDELAAAGRRIFVAGGIPEPLLARILAGRRYRIVAQRPIPIAEVFPQEGGDGAANSAGTTSEPAQ